MAGEGSGPHSGGRCDLEERSSAGIGEIGILHQPTCQPSEKQSVCNPYNTAGMRLASDPERCLSLREHVYYLYGPTVRNQSCSFFSFPFLETGTSLHELCVTSGYHRACHRHAAPPPRCNCSSGHCKCLPPEGSPDRECHFDVQVLPRRSLLAFAG